MDSAAWDERYAAAELVWSSEPNVFVVQVAEHLRPGRALDLACGEGRNAIWLARLGWEVTGVDFSGVAIERARDLAARAVVDVTWHRCDVLTWKPRPLGFDLVFTCYLHLRGEQMEEVLTHAGRSLDESGRLLVVGHARENLVRGTGGPQDPAILYEPEEVVGWLGGLEIERAEHVIRRVGTAEHRAEAIDTLVVARGTAGARAG